MGEEHQMYQDWLDQANSIGNITINTNTSDINTQEWDDWINTYTGALDIEMENDYFSNRLGTDEINLTAGGEEMLRVAKDGFYVRGVRVAADTKEAEAVYKAFKQWMTWAILNGEINN